MQEIKKITLDRLKKLLELRLTFDIDIPQYYHEMDRSVRQSNMKKYNSILDEYIPNDNEIEDLVYIYACRVTPEAFINRVRKVYPHFLSLLEKK